MGNISLIIGSGIIAFIAAYALFSLIRNSQLEGRGKEPFSLKTAFNEGLKILMLGLLIMSLFLVSKTAFDDKDHCAWLETNSSVSGNITSYNYDYICETNDSNTSSWVLKLPLTIIRVLAIMTILYLLYMIYDYFKWLSGDRRDDE